MGLLDRFGYLLLSIVFMAGYGLGGAIVAQFTQLHPAETSTAIGGPYFMGGLIGTIALILLVQVARVLLSLLRSPTGKPVPMKARFLSPQVNLQGMLCIGLTLIGLGSYLYTYYLRLLIFGVINIIEQS